MPTAKHRSSLDYSSDAERGIVRFMRDGIAQYRGVNGRLVTGGKTLARINALAIPPAWTGVWICANPRGHLQATGKDARGRKQYRYHPDWTAERDSNKFDSLRAFAAVLPKIRRKFRRDLARTDLAKRRVVAAVVALMDRTFIRVGSERYRKENGSFGVTTLRNRHVKLAGPEIQLDFRGKSGKQHRLEIHDPRVASVIRRCLDLPGQVLFQYREGEEIRSLSAADVNEYLREVSGTAVTSKDFRTWGGTLHVVRYLANVGPGETRTLSRQHMREAIKRAARVLGNTPAVCRRSYVHPAVLVGYEAGQCLRPSRAGGLKSSEAVLVSLLEASVAGSNASPGRRRSTLPRTSLPASTVSADVARAPADHRPR